VSLPDRQPGCLRGPARFLKEELRAYPGRANVALRCVLASALVIIISMALQVPLLALSLLVVFYMTQSNVVLTRLVGALFLVGATLGVGLAILVLKCSYEEPLLRILIAGAVFFVSVYLMRVLKVGVAFFLVAIVVIYAQTFVDRTDQPELLVRALLWVWVATCYPIALTLIINTLLLPAEPLEQLKAVLQSQLRIVDERLKGLLGLSTDVAPPGPEDVQREALTVQKLLRFVAMRDPAWRSHEAEQLAYVAAVSRLYSASGQPAALEPTPVSTEGVAALRQGCEVLRNSIQTQVPVSAPQSLREVREETLSAPLAEMRRALLALSDRAVLPESAAEREQLLVPDAFHNPVYAQFALKTLLATLVCYLFYAAVDWPGIHTIMLTCLIVAQPSLGATQQKAVLRIGGAVIGSLLALIMMIWVVPQLDSIVGLLLMTLPVLALGAWTTAGSERISYAGIQLVFTFSMALLDRFGPTTDLTEIRDRAIGILLGVAVSTVIHGALWPEGEGEALRQRLARLLRRVAEQLRSSLAAAISSGQIAPNATRRSDMALWTELGDCEAMAARVALEPGWQWGEGQHELFHLHMQTVLAQLREVLSATDAVAMQLRLPVLAEQRLHELARAVRWASSALERAAAELADRPSDLQALVVPAGSPIVTDPHARRLCQAVATLPAGSMATAPVLPEAFQT